MSIKTNLTLLACLGSFFSFSQQQDSTSLDSVYMQELLDYYVEAYQKDSLLQYQKGTIELGDGLALVNLRDDFKYLDPTEAEKILVEAWGNPPQETLGMIFPDSVNPYLFDGWGVILYYIEEGHINDEDAKEIDYNEMLQTMQEDASVASEERRKQGYAGYELVGWAESPYYDQESKKLHWAKELRFDQDETNTLNYDIRVLGRKGFLQLNAVAGVDQLTMVKPAMQELLGRVEFSEGNTYFDFDPSVDQVAAYGVGALVAGKLAAKAGILKVIGIFLVKFWKVILIAGAAVITAIRKFWIGKEKREIT